MIFFRQENNASAKFFPRTKGDKRRTGKIISCHISLGPEFFFFLFFFAISCAMLRQQFNLALIFSSPVFFASSMSLRKANVLRQTAARVSQRALCVLPCSHAPMAHCSPIFSVGWQTWHAPATQAL